MQKSYLKKVMFAATIVLSGGFAANAQIVTGNFVSGELTYSVVNESEKTCAVVKGEAAYPNVVVIPDKAEKEGVSYTVVGIKSGAFDLTTGLTEVTFPASLKYIENGAFFKTTKLKTVNALGTTPADISASPFATAVYTNATLNVPEGCWLAYQTDWTRFATVNEPGSYTVNVDGYNYGIISTKDKYARLMSRTAKFKDDFTVPSTVTSKGVEYKIVEIGRNCFDGCSELTSVTIPEGILAINDYAFRKCNLLKSVKLPSSVVYLAQGLFTQCAVLEKADLSCNTTRVENVTFQKCPMLKEVILPAKVEYVGASCFADCPELVTVTNADKLKIIMSGVFKNAPKLNLILPTGLVQLENSSFSGSGVTIGEWPAAISEIMASTFSNCPNIKTVVLPKKMVGIGASAFQNCANLVSITMPDSVDKPLGTIMFSGCKSLKTINIPKNITSLPMNFLYNCSSIEHLDLPDCIDTFGNYALAGLSSLKEIKLPSKLTAMALGSLMNCSSLTEVELPESVTKIGGKLFAGCTNLQKAKLSNKIELLNSYTFNQCGKLTTVEGIEGVTEIANNAFDKCASLKSFVVPQKVNKIMGKAFLNCTALESISLPESLLNIEKNAFENCTALTKITFPSKLESILDACFKGCTALTNVTANGERPAIIAENAFDEDTYKKATLAVPEGSLNLYAEAAGWKNFVTRTAGIDDIENESAEIYGIEGAVIAPEGARVYNISGIETGKTGLTEGIYIVVYGKHAYKVIVK